MCVEQHVDDHEEHRHDRRHNLGGIAHVQKQIRARQFESMRQRFARGADRHVALERFENVALDHDGQLRAEVA